MFVWGRRWLADRAFSVLEARRVHITPVSFESPIPDTRTLDDSLWERRSELPGLAIEDDAQRDLLARVSARYRDEYSAFPREATGDPAQYFVNNGGFESVDGEMAYCMIRDLKPARIFEIGSGNSTYVAAQAVRRNQAEGGAPCQLIAFEPYPNDVLQAGFAGLTDLVAAPAQEIPLERFAELEANDILFIDSSHVAKIGSDVVYLFLEVVPRLRPGVVVHVHDIFFPAEYPREWVMDHHWFWNEQYLCQAFLAFNRAFEVLWSGSYMHVHHSDALAPAFPSYDKRSTWPGSLWMRKTA